MSAPNNQIIRFFDYEHLPPALQEISKPICELARKLDATLPTGPETSAGLRKLLEAKDCFVRAVITPPAPDGTKPPPTPRPGPGVRET